MKLNIAQITPYYFPSIGGVTSVARYLSEELVRQGHKVDVITANRDHKGMPPLNRPKYELFNGVNIYRYNSIHNIGHMSLFPGLITHLMRNQYDVLHYHSYRHPLCEISSFMGKFRSCVKVLHGHGPFFEEGETNKNKMRVYNLYDKIAKKTVLNWSDKIISLNEYEKSRYIKIGVNSNKIVVIQNGANLDAFVIRDRDQFKKNLGIEDKKLILFVGIVNIFKRVDLIIKALPLIIEKIPNAYLVIIGPDGGELKTVQELGKQLNVGKYFTCLGPKYDEEKFTAFAGSDVFVLPSDWEGYPVAIVEAMASGLPVITTNIRGPKEMIVNEVTGLIINKGNFKELAESVISVLSDDALREKLSKHARSTAENMYYPPKITEKIIAIYNEVIESRTGK